MPFYDDGDDQILTYKFWTKINCLRYYYLDKQFNMTKEFDVFLYKIKIGSF